jgi:hypothetical protein
MRTLDDATHSISAQLLEYSQQQSRPVILDQIDTEIAEDGDTLVIYAHTSCGHVFVAGVDNFVSGKPPAEVLH